jgi:hypothetical protein
MVKSEVQNATVDWLCSMPDSELAAFLDFLVETALPGGGIAGRGGDKPYLGLKVLLQLLLQRCAKTRAFHDDGRRVARNVLRAEGRLSANATPAVLWLLAQLARAAPMSALRSWFNDVLPVVQSERANGGKLAVQCVATLKYIFDQLPSPVKGDGRAPPVTLERLVTLMEQFFPAPAEPGIPEKEKEKTGNGAVNGKHENNANNNGGKKVSIVNAAALQDLTKLFDQIVMASPVGLQAGSCAFQVFPVLLPTLASATHSPGTCLMCVFCVCSVFVILLCVASHALFGNLFIG